MFRFLATSLIWRLRQRTVTSFEYQLSGLSDHSTHNSPGVPWSAGRADTGHSRQRLEALLGAHKQHLSLLPIAFAPR